ncbi:MAG TPA: lactonase family protein [Flavisolibacter sp.]|jgi:6-phosphogluconolactonase|nr:lactonase family protein [Flavisolibacter sp.]
MKKIVTTLLSIVMMTAAISQPYLLVGTYTGEKSRGIYVYRFQSNGSAKLVDSAVTPNPSYLAISPDQRYVYAANELGNAEGGGKVTAFRFDKQSGKLTQLNQVPAMGEHPCYVTVDKTGKWVIVGNYSSGTVAVLPVQADGSLRQAVAMEQHKGRGPTDRQEKPHVHATVLSKDNNTLYVPDLGIDKLMIYAFNDQNGQLEPKDTTLKMPDGAGPRHFTIHPSAKWTYLLQELSGMVTVFKSQNGLLQEVQTISALPKDFKGDFTSADIHVSPDGKFLYASNRDASNTLAIFKINPGNGKLTLAGHQSVLGKTPRNFNFDPSGNFLLVANQRSDEIVVFAVNKTTGKLTDTGKRIAVGSPVCIKWISR